MSSPISMHCKEEEHPLIIFFHTSHINEKCRRCTAKDDSIEKSASVNEGGVVRGKNNTSMLGTR